MPGTGPGRNGTTDAVVVGAGVGGLAVALRLAAAGRRVVVCERATAVGGKLGLLDRDGFRFDTGPHLLTLPDVLRDTLAAAGARLEDHLELRPLDPLCRYRFADGTWWDHPAGDDGLVAAADALRPGNGAELRRFLTRAAAMWDATRVPFLESPLAGIGTLVRLSRRARDLTTIAPWRTLSSLARASLSDERLVAFVERFATYTGSDPRKAPAVLASILHAEHRFGAWYVEGGLRRIAEVLLERCLALGVDVRTATGVEGVVVRHGRAVGVRLADATTITARAVVANADATHLYRDLVPGPEADGARRALARTSPSLSGLVLLLALDRRRPVPAGPIARLPGMAHHTVLFPGRYHDEFDDIFGYRPRPVRDPAIYVSAPDDPAVAPPDGAAWFVLVNAPRHDPTGRTGIDWRAPGLAEREADRILDLMAGRGLDVRDLVRWRVVRTPADLEHDTGAVGGSIYGTSSNGARAAFLRPPNRSPVPGLFLVGGSSHPGGGLPLVQLSARITGGMILAEG